MACCPSRVRYDSQEQSQLSNTVFQMEQQMMMLEGANMQAATVNALKAGNDAMKKQMKEMNVDAVQDVMDDVADQMEEMQEITEALGQDLSGGMFDESELEAEFADLEEELLDEQLLDISVRILPRLTSSHRVASACHVPFLSSSWWSRSPSMVSVLLPLLLSSWPRASGTGICLATRPLRSKSCLSFCG